MSFTFFFPTLRRVIKLYCLQFVVFNSAYYEDNSWQYTTSLSGFCRRYTENILVPVQAKLSPAVTSTTCRLPFPMIFYKVMDNLEPILAIELMNTAQGVDFRRPLKTSPLLEHFLHTCRKEVPFVKDDIVMYKEIHKTVAFLKRTKFEY